MLYTCSHPFKMVQSKRIVWKIILKPSLSQKDLANVKRKNNNPSKYSYAWMCYKFLDDSNYFQSHFMECFKNICSDPVKNVRIAALTVLDKYIKKNGRTLNFLIYYRYS
jgi:hypothetical protein